MGIEAIDTRAAKVEALDTLVPGTKSLNTGALIATASFIKHSSNAATKAVDAKKSTCDSRFATVTK